ncbi:hypothetical protein B0H11DRAFT_2386321 [Mycena galericulata]|nr:hypothetical protein B0H11DRAFT_2386321 [Mycena galericulata]
MPSSSASTTPSPAIHAALSLLFVALASFLLTLALLPLCGFNVASEKISLLIVARVTGACAGIVFVCMNLFLGLWQRRRMRRRDADADVDHEEKKPDVECMLDSADCYSPHKATDRDELAGVKLWSVYISEAEKYDKALVERWKSDMEGMLIFVGGPGLFSASLTAFLTESYQTLSPDQGAITIELLAQISRQLDPASGDKSAGAAISPPFTPSTASLACNTLWFLSLGFSLSCAFIATSPLVRARIFSYLYFGLQRFGMHTMVEFIPLLLHVSLLLFLAGLVAFLHPINTMLMIVVSALLALISAIYIYLTILPMISSDAPSPSDEEAKIAPENSAEPEKGIPTMVEVMNHDATEDSAERDERDGWAIAWTVKSLTDNNELEAFVDALPDLIWGPNGRRRVYDPMINKLLQARDIPLIHRIEGLLQSCDSGLLTPELEIRRRISCLKALWTVTFFLASDSSTRQWFPIFNRKILGSQLHDERPAVLRYATSVAWLVKWISFCSLSSFGMHCPPWKPYHPSKILWYLPELFEAKRRQGDTTTSAPSSHSSQITEISNNSSMP